MFGIESVRNGAVKRLLILSPLLFISGDMYAATKPENSRQLECRELAESLSVVNLADVSLNTKSQEELATILSSKKLFAFIKEMDSMYAGDYPLLIRNLKQSLNHEDREKAFSDLKLQVSHLSQEDLEAFSSFIVKNKDPIKRLWRMFPLVLKSR